MTPPVASAGALRHRVLLAEADPGDAELVQIWLRRAQESQYQIWQVESLGDAEGCLAKNEFDLALVDLSLPDAPGPWAFHALHERCPELPIIVISSFADAEVAGRLVAEGAYDHLVKGQMSGDTLIRSMRHAVGHGRLARELRGARERVDDSADVWGELVSELAQDFRTPLHTVLGMADLLLETELTREQEGYVRSFLRSSEGLLGRLDALLAGDKSPSDLGGSSGASGSSLAPTTVSADEALRILVVDDSEAARGETRALLEAVGHEADPASDGSVALEMFREGDYDVVLTDLQMPELDGFETVRRFRVLEEELGRDPVPMLALTGLSAEASLHRALDAGCDGHLAKPLTRHALLEALARHAPKARSRMLCVDGASAEAVDHYLHDRHNDLAGLRMALDAEDYDSVRAVGHLLEGSADRQGFRELAEIGRALQEAANGTDRSGVERGAGQLTDFLREVKIVVRDA